MRKVVFFLLLFGAGLTFLLMQTRAKKPAQDAHQEPLPLPPSNPPHFTEFPVPADKPGALDKPVGVYLAGPMQIHEYSGEGSTRKRLYDLRWDDVDTLGESEFDLHHLEILIHDLETDAIKAKLVSPLSRLHIDFVDGKPSIGASDRALLSNVSVTLYEGAPVVPITLAVPLLEWQMSTNRFTSKDRVQIDGAGLKAAGVGLDFDTNAASFRLEHRGVIDLALAEKGQATLATRGDGAITVRRLGDAAQVRPEVEIAAEDGARLNVRGDEPLTVEGSAIHIRGRPSAAEEKTAQEFELSSVDADGDALLQGRNDTFQADRAEFVFAGSKIARATLTGSPRGLVQIGSYLPETQRKLRTAQAEISGAGPLVVGFEQALQLDLGGPGDLRVEDLALSIHAERSLNGSVDVAQKQGAMFAAGAVEIESQCNTLASDTLALQYALPAPGEETVVAVTSGPTHLAGPSADGREIALFASEGLEVDERGGHFGVPIALGVDIDAGAPNDFHAHADEVRDFDWDARTFDAQGSVLYRGARGRGVATRALAHGKDDVDLFGVRGAPARYELLQRAGAAEPKNVTATAEALAIHIGAAALDARGDVKVELSASDRTYHIASGALYLALEPQPGPNDRDRAFHALARDNVRTRFDSDQGESTLTCEKLTVDGFARDARELGGGAPVRTSSVRAENDVEIDHRGAGEFKGHGDLFTLDAQNKGRLSAATGRQVRATVQLPGNRLPYAMTAEWIEFDATRVEASQMDTLQIDGTRERESDQEPRASEPSLLEMRADHFMADEELVLLSGNAHARGKTQTDEDWTIDAGTIRIQGHWNEKKKLAIGMVVSFEASGGFDAHFGARAHAQGDRLIGNPRRVRIEGQPGRLELPAAVLESAWIEYELDNMLLASDKGVLRPRLVTPGEPAWSINYASLQPFDQGDTTILVLRDPFIRHGLDEVRAEWMLFWVDREEWRRNGQNVLGTPATGPELRVKEPAPEPKNPEKERTDLFAKFRSNQLARVLGEVYLEGDVEWLESGERRARAASIYLDVVQGHGWLQDADVLVDVPINNVPHRLRAKAKWMRVSTDGTLRADNAIVTSCEYDQPHYVIETGDLRLKQTPGKSLGWSVAAHSNALRFENGWAIPLPPLVWEPDEEGNSFVENIVAGSSSRFGRSVGASFNVTLGKAGRGFGNLLGKVLDFGDVPIHGHWKFDVHFLGSRGLLLSPGIVYSVKDRFKLDMTVSGIPDNHADKGLIRVPPDERSLLRTWFRARGRYTLDPQQWFDLALSVQNDPGVQSEFFERDFLNYEEKDNYLHWRKARDQYYFDASAKVLLEDRTDIEELPSIGAFRGRTPITQLFAHDLLYTSQASFAYLRRHNGDPEFYPPFIDGTDALDAPTTLGDREVARFDTEHRLELPMPLGWAGVRATPFVAARATVWDRGIDPGQTPARAGLFAGIDFATTFWKRYANGSFLPSSPTASLCAAWPH